MSLDQDLKALPQQPGVYLMKDARGSVLYVGKAGSLRNRVRSYFQPGADHTRRIRDLVQRVAEVDFKVTATEVEALILEANLIQEHQPRYNVRLRDDKRYPYLKLTCETFPRLVECRDIQDDGGRYFGPYVDAGAMRQTDKLLRRLFKLRSCTFDLTGEAQMRPCLDYHIGLCQAPCAGLVPLEQYQAQAAAAGDFLRGQTGDVLDRLQDEMEQAAEQLEFEQAAKIRDVITDARKVIAGQRVVSTSRLDADVLAVA
ncbi:MAG: excinuclease ABC subunit C, partial [Armatimonadetes bacterium]|nr:excinuclease ABC subunit C [Armatimonadota bacterium]